MICCRKKCFKATFFLISTFLLGCFVGRHNEINIINDPNLNNISFDGGYKSLVNISKVVEKVLQPCVLDKKMLKSDLNPNDPELSWTAAEGLAWALNVKDGEWSPPNCIAETKIAIIIPHRDRINHLKMLINHIHPFLQKQKSSYGIFVIEQAPGRQFNKASLLNLGFKVATERNYTCFIFHDVDLLPIDERNIYQCRETPFHLSVAVDKFNFRLIYDYLVGGVMAMTHTQFVTINGYSNLYFGWGAEDDDLSARLDAVGYKISRNPPSIARYRMISHSRDKGNPANMLREKLFIYARTRFREDGLNSMKYIPITNVSETKLFRKVTVQFCKCEILQKWRKIYNLPDTDD